MVLHRDIRRESFPHLLGRRLELGTHENEVELPVGRELQADDLEGIVASDQDEASQDGGPNVVGVVAADLLLGLEPGEDEFVGGETTAEELADGERRRRGRGGAGPKTAAQGETLMEGEGEADRAYAEHAHGGDAGDASTVPERVSAELRGGGAAGNVGDREGAWGDGGVDGDGDGVAEAAANGAPEEVEARAEVGYSGGGEGSDRPKHRGGVSGGGSGDGRGFINGGTSDSPQAGKGGKGTVAMGGSRLGWGRGAEGGRRHYCLQRVGRVGANGAWVGVGFRTDKALSFLLVMA